MEDADTEAARSGRVNRIGSHLAQVASAIPSTHYNTQRRMWMIWRESDLAIDYLSSPFLKDSSFSYTSGLPGLMVPTVGMQ